nr:DUF6412 domain-containing protein [Nocardia bovistercoris]
MTVSSVLAVLAPFLLLGAAPAGDSGALILLGAVATVAVVALGTPRAVPVPVPVAAPGPPASARRRRRGAYLRQSNPDSPGRPRPRAPGAVAR